MLAAQTPVDVDLDSDRAAVTIVRAPVRAQLEGADVAEGASVLAAGIRVARPAKAHALDRVESRRALNLEVLDGGAAGLTRLRIPLIEQTSATRLTSWAPRRFSTA